MNFYITAYHRWTDAATNSEIFTEPLNVVFKVSLLFPFVMFKYCHKRPLQIGQLIISWVLSRITYRYITTLETIFLSHKHLSPSGN